MKLSFEPYFEQKHFGALEVKLVTLSKSRIYFSKICAHQGKSKIEASPLHLSSTSLSRNAKKTQKIIFLNLLHTKLLRLLRGHIVYAMEKILFREHKFFSRRDALRCYWTRNICSHFQCIFLQYFFVACRKRKKEKMKKKNEPQC